MSKGKVYIGVLCVVCLLTSKVTAQKLFLKERMSVEASGYFNNILKGTEELKGLVNNGFNRVYYIRYGFQTLPSDSIAYDTHYNYPIIGVGLSGTDFIHVKLKNNSYVANIYSLYGYFDRSLYRHGNFRINTLLDAGLSFAPEPFSPVQNAWNEFVSSKIMVYIGVGLGVRYQLFDHWEVGVGIGLKHYSNGRMGMPNRGINMGGLDLSLRYLFAPSAQPPYPTAKRRFEERRFSYNVSVGGGFQTSVEEWELYERDRAEGKEIDQIRFSHHPKFALYNQIMYRYARCHASGLGADLYYTPHISRHRTWDAALYGTSAIAGMKYHPLSVGVSLNHEFIYRNFALYGSLGYYLFREIGLRQRESDFYQRGGFRYYFPTLHNLYVGYGIKAHKFSIAENMEFSVGFNLGRFK